MSVGASNNKKGGKMNPDETNPTTNTGTGTTSGAGAVTGGAGSVVPPALDFTSSDTMNLSMSDSLASAADNLTSAGMAAKEPDNGPIAMGEIGASDPSAMMDRPEEPLVPAAPVPGSIGSVTSGPAVTPGEDTGALGMDSMNNGSTFGGGATGFGAASAGTAGAGAAGSSTFGAMAGTVPAMEASMTVTPGVGTAVNPEAGTMAAGSGVADANGAATSEPYNPFASRMSGATGTSSSAGAAQQGSSMNVPTALQPATEKFSAKMGGEKKPGMLTVILAILAAVSLVMAIVFAVLWQQALANKEVVYVPSDEQKPVEQVVSMITCGKDLGADTAETMPGLVGHSLVATASFTNDQLSSVKMTNRYSFDSEEAANAVRPQFDEAVVWYGDIANNLGIEAIRSEVNIVDATANFSVAATPAQLMGDYIGILGLTAGADGEVDGSRESVQANYEAAGFVCAED